MSFETEYQNWLGQENLELYLREQLEKMTEAEKEDAFYRNLEFGTGGMRGVVGPGTNRMNVYTIRKANEGFAQYLLKNVENLEVFKKSTGIHTWKCRNCGCIVISEAAPKICPVCLHPQAYFELADHDNF